MDLSTRDLLLVSPEMAIVGIGLLLLAIDLLSQRKGLVHTVALAGLAIPLALTLALWRDIAQLEGAADAAFRGALLVDSFGLSIKLLLVGVLGLMLLASGEYLGQLQQRRGEFLGLVFLSTAGLMLLPSAADLITIFIALELASLPVAALAAFHRSDVRSAEAGVKYLVLSALSSAFLVYGFAFLYGAAGTVRLVSLDSSVPTIASIVAQSGESGPFGGYAFLVGTLLTVAGLGFKLSIVPFHMWTPDVYQGAPTPVAAYLAVASKSAAFALLLRIFSVAFAPAAGDWILLFAIFAAITMTVGNLIAIAQTHVKRLLGYSAIAHAGYMLVGVAAAARGDGSLGSSGLLFYLVAYAVTSLAAFFAIMAIAVRTNAEQIAHLAGMGKRSPFLAGVLSLALLSLTGLPPTAGFMGKLFLFNAAADANLHWLVLAATVNSAISAYYYLRIIREMYLVPPIEANRVVANLPSGLALGLTSFGILALGIAPSIVLDTAREAVASIAR